MAAELQFGMVLQDASGFFHLIHGDLTSRLQAMASQTAPIVFRTIKHQMDTSLAEDELIQKTFKRRVCVRSCDLHPSATAAERALRHSRYCTNLVKGLVNF